MTQAKTKPGDFVFRIERVFDAPRARAWKAWTDPGQFKQWFGPSGCTIIYTDIDLRAGGHSRYGMEFCGQKMFGQWAFVEVKEPERLVAIVSFLDENHNKIKHPMSPDWPMDIYSVVTFADLGGKTRISVEWTAHNATDTERKTFEDGMESMNQGWGGTFGRLEEFFSKG